MVSERFRPPLKNDIPSAIFRSIQLNILRYTFTPFRFLFRYITSRIQKKNLIISW